jgi:aromatic ring-opening dioxygenase LigB subunit
MIIFSTIVPHPPILLPSIGSKEDRQALKKTLKALAFLTEKLKKTNPDLVMISSPHPDWGIKVPLYFLKSDFEIKNYQTPEDIIVYEKKIIPVLTTDASPEQHFEWGKIFYSKIKNQKLKIALIASGDLSHCLKNDGPYGFNPDGPKFDKKLIESLKTKNIETILKLDDMFPGAGECGLRSFCFLLGALEASRENWTANVLSYEGPFGVGYLVTDLKI